MSLAWFVEEACDLSSISHTAWTQLTVEQQTKIIQDWQTHVGTKTDYVKKANFKNKETQKVKMDPVVKPENLSFEDFAKLDIRVGTILSAEAVPKSKKLLKLSVSFGPIGTRTILAGIAEAYNPDTIVMPGLQVVAVLNLAPRSMMGIESHGMLLAGRDATGQLRLINPNGIAEGGEVG